MKPARPAQDINWEFSDEALTEYIKKEGKGPHEQHVSLFV